MTERRIGAAPQTIDGVKFFAWRVGILRYQRRSEDGRIHVGDNGRHRTTYWASIDGVIILSKNGRQKRFRSREGAMREAIKLLKARDPQRAIRGGAP